MEANSPNSAFNAGVEGANGWDQEIVADLFDCAAIVSITGIDILLMKSSAHDRLREHLQAGDRPRLQIAQKHGKIRLSLREV